MLGRFSRQLRELPEGLFAEDRREALPNAGPALTDRKKPPVGASTSKTTTANPQAELQQKEEVLALIKVIFERELAGKVGDNGRRALEELLGLVRSGNLDALGEKYSGLISKIEKPSSDLQKAKLMLDRLYT